MYAGIEIGGTKQQICLCNREGRILHRVSERFPIPNGAADILAWIENRLGAVLASHPGVEALGVGFGGPIETATGRVLLSVQVKGWKDFSLKNWFEEKFRLPTTVVNDTVAGGYAELLLGSGVGFSHFYYTNIGTGIGGSFFMNGKTFDGIGYGGVYMGNTYTADPRGKAGDVCRLEELCSGTGIEARLRSPGAVNKGSLLWELCGGCPEKLNCKMLGEAAAKGDATALEHIDAFARSYGAAIANTISMLSPQRVSIGGGVANLGEILLAPVRRYAEKYVFASALGRYDIVPCALMDDNVIIGAALYARDGFAAL